MKRIKKDLLIILVWPIVASLLSFIIKADVLISMLLFFALPAGYLSYYKKEHIKKIALFSLITTIPIAFIVDYIMEHTGGWFLPYSVFGSFRLLGYVTIEQFIWLFLFIYFVAIFYEYFLDKECTPRLYHPKIKYLLSILILILGTFFLIYAIKPSLLHINYFYLKFGIIASLLPVVLMLFKFPSLFDKMLKTGIYFSFLSLIYEITALSLGQWTFPSENQFIGFVQILGTKFPLEEFLFWIVLGSIATISYYEFFDDDRR
ncbi:hypothetical protein J4229_02450 [Candidatus Pacearchaeota archaeon]|nr:hypothetical protein [Candidatus Pacearchaeota archaeon]